VRVPVVRSQCCAPTLEPLLGQVLGIASRPGFAHIVQECVLTPDLFVRVLT
jgi:hypothetical protein